MIWVGPSSEEKADAVDEARRVAWLAAVTGGRFANLSGRSNPCQGAVL